MEPKKISKRYQKLHPIQLSWLNVVELYIKANQQPDPSVEYDDRSFSMSVGHGEYDQKDKLIRISLKLEIGMDSKADESNYPFSLRISVQAEFSVKEEQFPVNQIYDWAKRNAPFILYPYIREEAFGLTARCGFRPILLPLLEVPTLAERKKGSTQMEKET